MGKETADSVELNDKPSAWSDVWKRAEAKAAVIEAKGATKAAELDAAVDTPKPPEPEPNPDEEAPDAAAKSETDNDKPEDAKDKKGVEGKPTSKERAKFREDRRKWHEKIKAREAEIEKLHAELSGEYSAFKEATKALSAGDFETACKKAFGISAAEFNKRMAQMAAGRDPEVERMKAKLETIEAEKRAAEEQALTAKQQREYEAAKAEWARGVSAELGDVEDFAHLSSEDWFVAAVIKVQEDHWDGEETLSSAEAAEQAREQFRDAYANLKKLFVGRTDVNQAEVDGRDIENPEVADRGSRTPRATKKGRKPMTSLSQREAAEVSSRSVPLTDDEWRRKWSSQLSKSA